MKQLKLFGLLPQKAQIGNPGFPRKEIEKINEALTQAKAPPVIQFLTSYIDLRIYCEQLPNDVQTIDLSGRISVDPSGAVIRDLMNCLKSRKNLTSLNLADNNMGKNIYSVNELGQGLQYLTFLTHLKLDDNIIGTNPVVAKSLRYLTSMISLDLSNNFIGYTDSRGSLALVQGLVSLRAI